MRLLILVAILLSATASAGQAQAPADLKTRIDELAALDYAVRTNAARLVRRAPATEAVPALVDAIRRHSDQFVRYRALIVLTSFNDAGTRELVRTLLPDRNDRLREVAYKWLERYPDPEMRVALLSALQTEQAEFVRPALVGALAALDDDAEVRRALTGEVTRGLDFFRSAAIDTLGHHRATYALDAIAGVSQNEGPLQHDAVLALGRIGGEAARAALAAVAAARADVQLTIRGARCLLGEPCDAHLAALIEAASVATASASTVRIALNAVSAMAIHGHVPAIDTLVSLSSRPEDLREVAAVAFGVAAVRRPELVIRWLGTASDANRRAAIELLKDGLSALEEDFGEEQFFAAARAAYWSAADNSPGRTMVASLIQDLEF